MRPGIIGHRPYNPLSGKHPDSRLNTPLTKGSGGYVYDISPTGHIGTITGATWESTANGWALDFNGSSDKVDFDASSDFDLDVGSFCVCFSAEEVQLLYGGRIIEVGVAVNRVGLHVWENGKLYLFGRKDDVATLGLNKAGVNDGEIHVVTGGWDADGAYLAVDGVVAASSTDDETLNLGASPQLHLGTGVGSTYYLNGKIYCASVFDYKLSLVDMRHYYLDLRRRLRI